MRLAYGDDGPGPVVVLLHGFPFDRSMWSAQQAKLGSVYRIIAPDLRGHGQSATTETDFSIDTMADDVVELLDTLQLKEPVVLGGLSMGGYVSLSLITRYPERCRALLLMDTRAGADSPAAALGREQLARTVEASASVAPAAEAMLPKLVSPTTRSRHPEQLDFVRRMIEATPPATVAGALRGMAVRPDQTAALAQIKVPTLVLVGADDIVTPPDESRAMARALPNAQLVIVPEAGHLAPLENSAYTNEAILTFLSKLP